MTAKKNPWFRMYSDFMFDEKIEFLAFEDQRHYVIILCMKNAGLLDKDYAQPGMRDRVVAKRLGLFGESFESAKKRLVESGLIDSAFQPMAWDKRQFISDVSTERVKAYRERMKQPRNVSETAQEADTDTDTEEEAKASMSPDKSDDAAADQKDKPESLPPCPHADLINLFAEKLPLLPQPKHELWSGARAAALKTRWRWVLTAKKRDGTRYATTRAEALDWFARFFGYVAQSDFLTGRDGKWTACDLGWLCNETNFAKVVQGNYDNKVAA